MIFEFDKDFAKEAIELGEGRIITKNQREVVVTSWDCDIEEGRTNFDIWGYFSDSEVGLYWTKNGKLATSDVVVDSEYDLLIEVFDDNTINSKQ